MRKYLLLIIALCLHIAARGQTITSLDDLDLSGLPQPTTAKALRYWFDDDDGSVTTASDLSGSHSIDVSGLIEGLHTLHYQVIASDDGVAYVSSAVFLKMNHGTSATARSLRYWFDDDNGGVKTATGTSGTYVLDASELIDGLHTLHYQVTGNNDVLAYVGSRLFLKMNGKSDAATMKNLRYWFDDDNGNVKTITSGGVQTLDVSAMLDGLHTIHYQVTSSDGMAAYVASALFLKTGSSFEAENVKAQKLMYWFDDDTAIQQTDISEGAQLIDASTLIEGLHTLHYQVLCNNGQMTPAMSTLFLRMNADAETAVAKNLRYWFDDEQTATEAEITNGVQLLDASKLIEGLHTVHYQIANSNGTLGAPYSSIFLKMNWDTSATTAKSLRYWYDDEQTATETAIANGTQTLDAAKLIDGLHTVHYQIVDSNGTLGAPYSSVFLKMDASAYTTAESLRYWFDDDATTVATTSVAGGTQTLDVSALSTGLHTLNYQLIDSQGRVTAPVTRLFLKNFDKVIAEGHNRVTKYQYWLNANSQAMQTVELPSADNPYTLIALLPMQKEPIHSDCFHFEMTNGVPTIYAKNILHVRFHDAQGYFSDGEKPFMDYSVKQDVEPVGELQATQTFLKVTENDIRWYTMLAAPGDTTAFRLSQAATLQVFAPSGKEVFKTSESASVQWGGIHTWEDGTYYVAVHDVTGSQSNMTLDYMHMDKYDVVDWDVHTVGNGGCSTITFKGNGFRDLYRVDLYTAAGDSIHSVDISHDSDAETAVTFDFSGAELGVYNAVFHFTQEDKRFTNIVTVEEATDFNLVIKSTFASQYLRGTTNRYTFKVRNNSNMTAYHVPMPIQICVADTNTLKSVEIGGYNIKQHLKNVFGTYYTDSLDQVIDHKMMQGKDLYYFLREPSSTVVDGLPYRYHAFICPDLRPNTTEIFTISITSTGATHVYMWCSPVVKQENNPNEGAASRRSNVIEDTMCALNQEHARQCEDNERAAEWNLDPPYNVNCPPETRSGCPGGGDGGTSTPQPPSDPNDIYGYLSDAGSKFMTDEVAKVNYTIEFENDTAFAQASAHTIVIRDTLDSRYFDLKSFLPTSVKIGEREAFLDEVTDVKTLGSMTSFLKTIDMRPEINALAQVQGEYNQQTGIAKWTFTSLDPMTMEPTDDLMQGILPVNYNGTSGIGEVMFEVGVKPNKADGTQIPNRAGIVFDYEESILTPTWTNIVDATAPESHVADVKMLNDSTATVSIEATDELSGPWRYDVYVQYGTGSAWWKAAENVPIDTTASVKVYEGINHGFYVVVTDSAGNVEQKNAEREFTLEVFGSQVDTDTQLALAEGWNWVSHNQNEAMAIEGLKPSALRMVGQTEETIKDTRFGWMGDLEELLPTQMYKLQMSEAANVQLSGRLFNAGFRSIPLYEGWNWIGYPVANVMTPAEALSKLEAEEGDFIIGQDGMATFSDGQWTGTLTEMQPGLGYMYRSASNKNLFYNATAQASARQMAKRRAAEVWTVDKRKYPNVMAVVANLCQNGVTADADEWLLAAFCGDECRGVASTVNGVLMMNVYGTGSEPISFYAMNRETEEVMQATETEEFRTDVLGSMQHPYELHIGEVTGIVEIDNGKLTIDNSVYDLQGRRIGEKLSAINAQLKKGIYIVTDGKNTKTQKVVRK